METKMRRLLDDVVSGKIKQDMYNNWTSFPVQGDSPWGDRDNPPGVWAWAQPDDEVIVGSCASDFRIVSYDEARNIFAA